jgi:histidine triad (HIT) family protein
VLLRHQTRTAFLCATVVYPISSIHSPLAYLNSLPIRRYLHPTTNYHVTTSSLRIVDVHRPVKKHNYSLKQIKMSSASTPHDEIVKAMAAAAEIRERKDDNDKDDSAVDDAPLTIFDKLLSGAIPCNKVYEDDIAFAFHDVNPVAPIHILVIPKVRSGLTQISKATTNHHQTIIGHCMMVASQIGKQYCGDKGFRLVVNDGENGGQSVYHLHIHIFGGRQMQWPPG